jgi:ABC-type branched-subunit amino acid transport system ATPase component
MVLENVMVAKHVRLKLLWERLSWACPAMEEPAAAYKECMQLLDKSSSMMWRTNRQLHFLMENKGVLEIVRALATEPTMLLLDEPLPA